MEQNKKLINVGFVAAAHGIKGQIKLRSFTEIGKQIFSYNLQWEDGSPAKLKYSATQKDNFICWVEGITDRNVAEGLIKKQLFVLRDELPETAQEEFYLSDIIGLEVISEAGAKIGKVKNFLDFGAGEILEIEINGEEEMHPFLESTFPEINLKEGWIKMISSA